MKGESKLWVKIALINLCIVAGLGALMRYKIGFEFPHFNQKYLQEAHSHFAFTGWITHCLFFLIVGMLQTNLEQIKRSIYQKLIWVNLGCAYGMLISFYIQGYGPVSLFFSTLSLLTAYTFSFFVLRDISSLPHTHPAKKWIQASLWLGILSTFGTMVLSVMMATRQFDQNTYLGSVYFYLHFQYNGWFLFACIGLFLDQIKDSLIRAELVSKAFWLMFLSCIPAYFLSTLWAGLPLWLYVIVVIAAITQVIGWGYLVQLMKVNHSQLKSLFSGVTLFLFLLIALAFSLKLLLQLGSTVPEISKLAFGFRPIVIAYLHLVLLVITTLFLLTFMLSKGFIPQSKRATLAIFAFATGAILTEVALTAQGIAGFKYIVIPLIKEILFGLSLLLFVSALWLTVFRFSKSTS